MFSMQMLHRSTAVLNLVLQGPLMIEEVLGDLLLFDDASDASGFTKCVYLSVCVCSPGGWSLTCSVASKGPAEPHD